MDFMCHAALLALRSPYYFHTAGSSRSSDFQAKCVIVQGFRRYLSIRQTLCHELAHMVYSEHDANFKRLNSQLCAECSASSVQPGVRLFEAAQGWDLNAPPDPADVMSATATSSGQTLRQLAGNATLPPLKQVCLSTTQPFRFPLSHIVQDDSCRECRLLESSSPAYACCLKSETLLKIASANMVIEAKGEEDTYHKHLEDIFQMCGLQCILMPCPHVGCFDKGRSYHWRRGSGPQRCSDRGKGAGGGTARIDLCRGCADRP